MTAAESPAPGGPHRSSAGPPAVLAFCDRYYVFLAAAVLALAAFNVLWRLGSESVTQWDESLYAISALETARHGNWIAITFRGAVDYYNDKPPLNIWLIALAFKAFGVSLVSLRLTSALSAWLTVAIVMQWARNSLNAAAGLLAGLALSTTFGFLYVHSGRTANADALFALLMLLTVVTLWAARTQPRRRAWLGLIAAGAFLLKGTAVLMPLAIVAAVEAARKPRRPRGWFAICAAGVLFVVPIAAWVIARWRFDGWLFLTRLLHYDFLARMTQPLEGHGGGVLYYVNVLQRYQYEWLIAAAVAWILYPVAWARLRTLMQFWREDETPKVEIGCWMALAFLIPTVMRTKASWYLNPFYPACALVIGAILAHACAGAGARRGGRVRLVALWCVVLLALGAAEGRLVWHSLNRRDMGRSVQGLLLAERSRLTGHAVYHNRWDNPEIFVIEGLLDSRCGLAADVPMFLRDSRPGDFVVTSGVVQHADLAFVRSDGRHFLYRRLN